ncbi:MAG: YtpR family tRNA-binding protein [Breznakia sp.]
MIVRVFYNGKAFPNVLYVVLHNREVAMTIKKDSVTKLLDVDGEIIGYNILIDTYEGKTDGYQVMSYPLLRLINTEIFRTFAEELIHDFTSYIVVGYVEKCEDHPDSNHLHVCKVRIGDTNHIQIVCGAKNVRQDIKVVVCLQNAVLADGTLIKNGKLRGVESFGMLANAKEIGLKDAEKKGIIILDDKYNVGDTFKE